MSVVKHARGLKLVLKVGNGADQQVFTAKCSINSARGITFTAATNDIALPDCDDDELLAWLVREKVSVSAAFNGAGMLNTPDVQEFFDWSTSPDSVDCQVVVDVPSADGGVIFEGAWHCTEFGITGDRGAKQECSIALASDGVITCAANT